ncbi:MAG: GAF domain-containing protein [Baekduia sp.]
MEATTTLERRQLDRLLAMSQSLVRVLDIEAVLSQLLEAARELTGGRYAAIGILDEDRSQFARFVANGIDYGEQGLLGERPTGRGVLGTVIRALTPVRIDDIAAHADSSGFPEGHPPMRSFLGVPVLVGDEAWGVIYCAEQEDGAFTGEHERLLSLLSGWASIAIGNADLYERSEHDRVEVARALRAHRATREVAQAIGSDLELDHVLTLIAERGRPLAESQTLMILLREDETLRVAAWSGDRRESAASVIAADVQEDDVETWASLGVSFPEAVLMVPMIYRGESIGVLVAFRSGRAPFTDADREILETYAASAATRVTIARSVRRERLQDAVVAADAERRRWARELHDQTLQGLAAIRLMLTTRAGTEADGSPACSEAVHGSVALIDDEISSLRAIIADLRPATLDELGWDAALDELIRKRSSGGAPEVVLSVEGAPAEESADRQAAAYRIIQEAIGNAVRHAAASTIWIDVNAGGGSLRISVRDDGHGFDPEAPTAGLGLVGMRERVELAGGSLAVDSGASGTTIVVEF